MVRRDTRGDLSLNVVAGRGFLALPAESDPAPVAPETSDDVTRTANLPD